MDNFLEGLLFVSETEQDPNPHFELHSREDETERITLTAGTSIQVQVQYHWIHGRVELGYYGDSDVGHWFLSTGDGDTILFNGQQARIRR